MTNRYLKKMLIIVCYHQNRDLTDNKMLPTTYDNSLHQKEMRKINVGKAVEKRTLIISWWKWKVTDVGAMGNSVKIPQNAIKIRY